MNTWMRGTVLVLIGLAVGVGSFVLGRGTGPRPPADSGYSAGFQVFNMMDPTNPYTVGFYNTRAGANFDGVDLRSGLKAGDPARVQKGNIFNGAWGVDIRNADGLVVVSDFKTGFWAFKMDGFDGWNGHQWGMPNISSAQDWDNGPDGAPKPAKVS